jgi:uncharacterized protein YdhG (YjbR/CyaY superfamily)
MTGRSFGESDGMKPGEKPLTGVDAYIARFPRETQVALEAVRAAIRAAAPGAIEKISYGMPTFARERDLIHFGAFKTHIGLFPPVRDPELQGEILPFRGEKGNLRFPLDQPMPLELIGRIAAARLREVEAAAPRRRVAR